MNPCATTIVSANYLAYAAVLAESVRAHLEGSAFVVLLVERRSSAVEQRARQFGLDIIWAEDLGLPDFERIAYQFDSLELNTALKPTLLKRLLDRGHESVIYWDPDVWLFARPTPILQALQECSVVLTPHTVAPLMDGHRPSDIDLMRHGTFNLGFIAVRGDANGRALLDWWEDRCLAHGFRDPVEGTFVDQKWLDLAPSFFDGVKILKHRGCNVAYWNLHERPLSADHSGSLHAGNDTLIFFHFSGLNPTDDTRLSRYQDRHPLGGSNQLLGQLVTGYCTAVMAAGYAQMINTPYSFGVLDNGQPISLLMRRALVCSAAAPSLPFAADGDFQRGLRAAGLWTDGQHSMPETHINAFSFDASDRRIRLVNKAVRASVRLIGPARAQLLLKYLVFLSRGSHLAAVLTGQPFMLKHQARSTITARIAQAPEVAAERPVAVHEP